MPSKNARPTSRRKTRRNMPARLFTFLKLALSAVGLALVLTVSGFTYAATQESHDDFCASCHTTPESTFYARSIAAQPVDLASAHQAGKARCIDCHSGAGVSGRISAEMLGAHNALAFYTGQAVQPAPLTHPVGDISCLKCHQDVTQKEPAMNTHFHVFLSRWQAQDPNAATCVSCHQAHVTGGDATIMYLNETPTRAVCQSCHEKLRDD